MVINNFFGNSDFKGVIENPKKLVYNKIPTKSYQAMPIGTGCFGAALFAPNSIMLQINHNANFKSDGSLPGMLRVLIEFDENPFKECINYYQELDLQKAQIKILIGTKNGDIEVSAIAHKMLGTIFIDIKDNTNVNRKVRVVPILWRNDGQIIVVDDIPVFYEENRFSAFNELNKNSSVIKDFPDPLINRKSAVGVFFEDSGLVNAGVPYFEKADGRMHRIFICAAAGKQKKDDIIKEVIGNINRARNMSSNDIYETHKKWWNDFFEKSYIQTGKNSILKAVNFVWNLNRYFAASTMDGEFPPKFNGSIFLYEHDRRSWCGPYWFQNTRLMYWPLFKTGDIEYIKTFIDMYFNALEFSKERVKSVYNHKGAIFLETMHFWGCGRFGDVNEKDGVVNKYIRAHFTGSLELIMIMVEYFKYTGDESFARHKLFPLANEVYEFFFSHFPVRDGKLFLHHSSCLETWWDVDNPTDQVSGLRATLSALVLIGKTINVPSYDRDRYEKYLNMLPAIPIGKIVSGNDGYDFISDISMAILPAKKIYHHRKENVEDPELYTVWPFNLYGIGKDGYDIAKNTYYERIHKEPLYGWSQTAIWAARLGLKEEAREMLKKHFSYSAVLPGGLMTSPGNNISGAKDIPDCGYFDTVGAISIALNEMLMQNHDGVLRVLPAWPEDEEVSFKLHSYKGEIIQATNK